MPDARRIIASIAPNPVAQAGVVPVLAHRDGLRVALVSSSSGRRWVLPKGTIDPGETAARAAAREADEEAGVRGELLVPALGRAALRKAGIRLDVEYYALRVTHVAERWAESQSRHRRWLRPETAFERLGDARLRTLVRAALLRFDA